MSGLGTSRPAPGRYFHRVIPIALANVPGRLRRAGLLLAVVAGWSISTTGCASLRQRAPSVADSIRARAHLVRLLADHQRFAQFRNTEFAAWSAESPIALPDVSRDRAGEDALFARGLLSQLDGIWVQAMTQDDYVTWLSLRWDMEILAGWQAFHGLRVTDLSPSSSVLSQAATLLRAHRLATADDGRRYLALVRQLTPLVNDLRTGLAERVDRGVGIPRYAIPRIVRHVRSLVAPPDSSPFGLPAGFVTPAVSDWRSVLADSVAQVITQVVNPALQQLADHLEGAYQAFATDRIGLAQYPGGAVYFDALLRAYSTLEISASEAHAIGAAEVARLALAAVVERDRSGLPVSRDSLRDALSTDPRFALRVDSSGSPAVAAVDAMARQYRESLARLDSLFGGRGAVRLAFGLMDAPSAMFLGITSYQRPTAQTGEGRYRVNADALLTHPAIAWPAMVHRDLVPGGHYQVSRQVTNTTLPPARQLANHAGFVRGWQAYAMSVADSLLGDVSPAARFGTRLEELALACGLVVDTGINAFLWSRDDALAFLRSYLPFDEAELERYVTMAVERPGWLSAAPLGARELRGLRAWVQQELGDRFSLARFHAEVLRVGSVPLPVLGSHLERWIWEEQVASQRQNPAGSPPIR